MLNINGLWKNRFVSYHQKIMRYAKYMFNDHFVLVVIFLLGFLMVQFSNWVHQLTTISLTTQLVLSFVLALLPFIGSLATLVEPADVQFLSVVGQEFKIYLRSARVYSWILPLIVNSIGAGLVFSIFSRVAQVTGSMFFLLLGQLVLWKSIHFDLQQSNFQARKTIGLRVWLILLGVQWMSFFCSCHFLGKIVPWVIIGILLLAKLALVFVTNQQELSYDWMLLVETELSRQQRIFRLIALFVDVPYVQKPHAKRRKWLDFFVEFLAGTNPTAYRFLIARTLVRSQDYLPVVAQLGFIGLLVAILSSQWYWVLLVNTVLMLVASFQLISLKPNRQHQAIYVNGLFLKEHSVDDFIAVNQRFMFVMAIVMGIVSFIGKKDPLVLGGFILYPVMIFVLSQWYLRPRFLQTYRKTKA